MLWEKNIRSIKNTIISCCLLFFVFTSSSQFIFAQEPEISGIMDMLRRVNQEAGFEPSQEEKNFQQEVASFLFTRKGMEPGVFHSSLVILEKSPYQRRALLSMTLARILNTNLYKSAKRSNYYSRDNELMIRALQAELMGDNITAAYIHADRINLATRQNQKIKKIGDFHLARIRNLAKAGEYDEAVQLVQRYHPLATIRVKVWMNDVLSGIPDEFLKFKGNTVSGKLVDISSALGPEKYIKFTLETPEGNRVKFMANQTETVCVGKKIENLAAGDKLKAVVINYFARMIKVESE